MMDWIRVTGLNDDAKMYYANHGDKKLVVKKEGKHSWLPIIVEKNMDLELPPTMTFKEAKAMLEKEISK
jgi:hypothetical protein